MPDHPLTGLRGQPGQRASGRSEGQPGRPEEARREEGAEE